MILAPTFRGRAVYIHFATPHIRIGLTKIKKRSHAVVYDANGNCTYDGGNPLGRVDRVLLIVKNEHKTNKGKRRRVR